MKHYFEDKTLTFEGQFGTAILSLGDMTNFLVRKGSSGDVKWVVQAKVLEFFRTLWSSNVKMKRESASWRMRTLWR